MQHSIATVSLSGTLPEKLEAIAAAGFDGVEIFENDLLYFDGSPRDAKRICDDLGLKIMLFQPFRDFEGGRRDKRQHNLDRAERKFDLMQELGTDRILVCSSVQPDVIRDDALIADDFAKLAERAAKRDILVGYEALAWGRYVNSYRHVWDIVKAVDHPNLGIILDSFHTLSINDDLSTLTEISGDKIVFLQLADAPLMAMDVMEWSRHFRCFPGQGEFDLASFLGPILKNGYKGPLSLEIFNDGFRAAPTRITAADGLRSLLYLEETTRNALRDSANVDTETVSSELFAPPPPVRYGGVEFLEFAVDDMAARRLASWFDKLGFAHTGTHKSKNVSLYSQGGVNLILNAEPDSFAHAFFVAHGPSLCAAAFRVDDSRAALERAKLYKSRSFESRVGPNERQIPAVRAPDGSLQYLVDPGEDGRTIYDSDFDPVEMKSPQAALLTGIDHFALGLPAETLDTWILFFRAVYGFTTEHEWVLPDPYGLVKSRVVRSPDGAIRVPLNISENRNTAIARSVSTYRGSGLQHVAFATGDIFAAVAAAREAGLPLLEIPRNYYDDLAARFDLDPAFIERLAEANVLYDRDPNGGELLHVYTEPFEDRFFFEIIERHHGYEQYGAANVPVRLAAQAQSRARQQSRPAPWAD
ncbi:bifunctional sugar phosphate isomerase/epimerase/4-hydroxyphenylpyruvate dioxygenase family protein [Crenobacter sp. SG2305]|uniref:bifunctional sugar phosphate isomerase/epimerase/4-hydroxyphenylpyruvate dioxygenase family protein n=1 Tax=Crenobacter oryzisoli TaxID=3056844 RepID=UPI0025AA55C6|nr:bifunctional sugar phosphate isomerase/epimerase/4-hydroxyphenylpyruvate dioxygenase family protein [Crenobacter sp. SG2305]MDN0081694.1 bifunctional sugar phosphate isomerase/epimerase/4-hydroxyphenylpyruvate dioxygenase family protein [Crenobacter sp. SG2305]